MQYKIYIGSPSITFTPAVPVIMCSCSYGGEPGMPNCGYCGGRRRTMLNESMPPPEGKWVFNDKFCGYVDKEVSFAIANLTNSLAKFRSSSGYQTYEPDSETLDCFAPDYVGELGKAILSSNTQEVERVIQSNDALAEMTIVKDKSWILNHKNKNVSSLDSAMEYQLTPLLLSVLSKQNEISLKLLDNISIDLNSFEFQGKKFFELLQFISSSLSLKLADKYPLEICKAWCDYGSYHGPNLFVICCAKLTLEQAKTFYTYPNFQEYIQNTFATLNNSSQVLDKPMRHAHDKCLALKTLYSKGIGADDAINNKQERLLPIAIKNQDFNLIKVLVMHNADFFSPCADGKSALELLNWDRSGLSSFSLNFTMLLPQIIEKGLFLKFYKNSDEAMQHLTSIKAAKAKEAWLCNFDSAVLQNMHLLEKYEPKLFIKDTLTINNGDSEPAVFIYTASKTKINVQQRKSSGLLVQSQEDPRERQKRLTCSIC